MTLQQKLNLKLQQKMVLTPSLQQAIRLLQLTRLELQDEVTQEIEANPVLEEATTLEEPEGREEPEKQAEAEEVSEMDPMESYAEKIDVEAYFQDYMETSMKHRGDSAEIPEDAPDAERYLSRPESLSEHMEWQIALSRLSSSERRVARTIVGNLNEEGYLTATAEEIAAASECTPEFAVEVLGIVQRMDPVGVAARDVKECLLIQLGELYKDEELAARIVRDHFESLDRMTPEQLAQATGHGADEVADAMAVIRHLDPKPGLRYNNPVNPVIEPDVIVEKDGEAYRVRLNEDGMPKLRLSSRYRQMAESGGTEADAQAYLKEKVRSALWFLKGIEERHRTIYNVACQVVDFQKDFLDKGRAFMKPLILRDVADRVGVHESTVSRVVSNKYMQTPRGILPMKYFFTTGISTLDGTDVSAMRVKEKIKDLVESESPRSPLSDQRLADILKREGILLARRTVAKYREELNIPTSARRKAPAKA